MDKNPSAKVAAKTAKRRMKQRVVVAGRRMKYQIVQDKEKHEAEMNYKFKVTKAEQQQLRVRYLTVNLCSPVWLSLIVFIHE